MARGEKVVGKLVSALEFLGSPKVVVAVLLLMSFTVTLLARLTPMHWGVYLNEFDPYYEYYLSEQLLAHGNGNYFAGVAWWYHWWFENPKPRDTLFWAPEGRDLRGTSQPGPAFFSAGVYTLLRTLGFDVSLYYVHAFLVPFVASLAVFTAYLLGSELKDYRAGVLASVLIALSWAYMYRTNLGAKHEAIAIPFMLLGFYLFLKGYKKKSLLLSILAGLSLGVVVLAWGAYVYPWNLLALVVLFWLFFHPDDTAIARSYVATNLVVTFFVATTPRFGPSVAFMSFLGFLPLVATLASILVIFGIRVPSSSLGAKKTRRTLLVLLVVLLVVFALGTYLGVFRGLAGRIMAVVMPLVREPGVTTVAEHQVPTWNQLFDDFQTSLIFAFFAGYLYFLKSKDDFNSAFISLFIATAVYFSASIVRLLLLLSPAVAIAGSLGLVEILDRLALPAERSYDKRHRGASTQTTRHLAILIAVILLLLFSPSILASKIPLNSHQPPLILTSSVPLVRYDYEYMDWLSALQWISENVPRDATIATWWDYGYWISVNTGRKTTCDNATIDTKQIQKIAKAFMSDEDTALRIFKELNVSYVVVFEPLQQLQLSNGLTVWFSMMHPALGGDIAKSPQMLKWIGLSANDYIYGYNNGSFAYLQQGGYTLYLILPANTPQALNATLYRMVYTRNHKQQVFIFDPFLYQLFGLQGYKGPTYTFAPLKNFELVYVSEPNGWVKVFRVKG
ncbi:STT3 domain-containing protein [Thermofilum pendens]|uniref:dolichyl-phosphooligosaccharide-protein glycotransferase n=1 Tax=Thermofilum pendens (strain DSM 2475 / Hrk 5) TaxID=368408 RepID=A1RXW3_THEPD|nr:STT3 domain-containing protein [Thermofilum pendens]ABL78043.1 Oligosaccharyl transferase, STT3 subunit [Thermofilum pendens Hrk 5]